MTNLKVLNKLSQKETQNKLEEKFNLGKNEKNKFINKIKIENKKITGIKK